MSDGHVFAAISMISFHSVSGKVSAISATVTMNSSSLIWVKIELLAFKARCATFGNHGHLAAAFSLMTVHFYPSLSMRRNVGSPTATTSAPMRPSGPCRDGYGLSHLALMALQAAAVCPQATDITRSLPLRQANKPRPCFTKPSFLSSWTARSWRI